MEKGLLSYEVLKIFDYIFMSIVILCWQLDNMAFTAKLDFFLCYLAAIRVGFFPSIHMMRLEIKILALICFLQRPVSNI